MSPEIKAIERRVSLLQVKEQTITESIGFLISQRHAIDADILRLSDIKQDKIIEVSQRQAAATGCLSGECE